MVGAREVVGSDPYFIADTTGLESPSLLVFRAVVRSNIERMIKLAGSAERLRPHVKTHKMPAVIALLEASGVHAHKCATIAEAEMVASAGGRDVLLAYPLVGPNIERFGRLMERFPETTFRATVDDEDAARGLARLALESSLGRPIRVLLDLDVGMGRTGIDPERAADLYRLVATLPGLEPDGLHAYDGHLRDFDPDARRAAALAGEKRVLALRDQLVAEGLPVPRLVFGGTPTFPAHAAGREPHSECSPGTCIFHDHSYMTKFPDLGFQPAAFLLTRVISRPGRNRVCLDVGHKAVAADPAGDRIRLWNLDDATLGPQSEEHLVVNTPSADRLKPGTALLALPTHICPTCALHREATVIEDGQVVDRWPIAARDRRITI